MIPSPCPLQDGCGPWGALTGGVERVENSRNILELQGFGEHMRSQVITQDLRAGQEQFAMSRF